MLKLALNWLEERLTAESLTIEHLVQSENQNQAADQVSVGNSINSLRFLDAMNWREFVETLSHVEQTLRQDPADVYSDMDFATRDRYRHLIETIARRSDIPEPEVAARVVEMAKAHAGGNEVRRSHVGYFLMDEGFAELEQATRAKVPLSGLVPRWLRAHPLKFYAGGIAAISLALAWFALAVGITGSPPPWLLALIGLVLLLCGSQLALAAVNWLATNLLEPHALPRLDFSQGIPSDCRTLVVVPTLMTSRAGVESLLDSLEVRYLANRDPNVSFALLTDWSDASTEHVPGDEQLLSQARAGIEGLNEKYCPGRQNIFYLLHRPRRWNPRERVWMGYERKRGKLGDLNRLLRGENRDAFLEITGDLSGLAAIKYVITLDTDTQLPRDVARQLAGTMAHPLNRPVRGHNGRVVEGYSILQPRVAVSLPAANRSRFAKLYSGDPGIDPYTRAVSDVYQDLFQEGSFIGKGIYDVDAFELALGNQFPENRILSHDLLEGSYARSGLISDVQLFEDFPASYSADAQRRHRWMRGDWQIASWLLPRVPGPTGASVSNPTSGLSRWKIFDNLRRSLVPVALFTLLVLGWTVPAMSAHAVWWSVFALAVLLVPCLMILLTDLVSKPTALSFRLHLRNIAPSTARTLSQALLSLVFLPFEAMVCLDATIRTLVRLSLTRRRLLEWRTAGDVDVSTRGNLANTFRAMWWSPLLALLLGGILVAQGGSSLPVALPFLLVWLAAPALAWWISLPLEAPPLDLTASQKDSLRVLARKTWRYFETFIAAPDHWLPPDNFQEHPHPVLATRTSPTNIGMGLMSTLAAWDFGYLTLPRLLERTEATLETMGKLERYHGHFYNWYDTRTLQPLLPLYVSTVDNGNLAGLLLTFREGLLEAAASPFPHPSSVRGLRDTLGCWQQAVRNAGAKVTSEMMPRLQACDTQLARTPQNPTEVLKTLSALDEEMKSWPDGELTDDAEYEWWRETFARQCSESRAEFLTAYPWLDEAVVAQNGEVIPTELQAFLDSFVQNPTLARLAHEVEQAPAPVQSSETSPGARPGEGSASSRALAVGKNARTQKVRECLEQALETARGRAAKLQELAQRCDDFARMDFTFLYDDARKLFVIGYNVSHHRLDGSYYDLLASEARLASFVAIALGQVPQEHWFALGRLLTAVDNDRTLLSWSGSMFEYLMPPLVMPSYDQSLLHVSCRSAVLRQIDYGRQCGVPWGMSESGYNLTDAQSNYQYRAFGVPGLGFKRGLAEDVVVAPYATLMAFLVSPQAAWANLERLKDQGAEGRYGFFEALDFTPTRLPRGRNLAIVQSFMAHHQGMGLLALAHTLLDQPMQRRFTANPLFRAVELLLQERIPKETTLLFPNELEATRGRSSVAPDEATFRVLSHPDSGPPEVHLLSNGRYHVMLTNSGGGYSQWNDTALTRWREDPTRDCWGAFAYLRDRENGQFWSVGHQPVQPAANNYEAIFSQGRGEYRMRHKEIDAHMEIAVSPEDDIEVRRVTLSNYSSETRIIELTSFAEVALTSPAADQAHPAFAKLFVQTQIVRERHALLCSRRPRARGEQPLWMFHLMLLQGEEVGTASFETDRARFLGRGRTAASPAAMDVPVLSNSEGPVLDPAVAIRRSVRLSLKQNARLTLVTGCAPNAEALARLVE
jgi:cyclic beta-1,2-glucan synthetase